MEDPWQTFWKWMKAEAEYVFNVFYENLLKISLIQALTIDEVHKMKNVRWKGWQRHNTISVDYATQLTFLGITPYDGPNRPVDNRNHSTWLNCTVHNDEDFFGFLCKSYRLGEN